MLDRDQPLPPLSEFLEGLSDITQPVSNEEAGQEMYIDDVKVKLPFELGIRSGDSDTLSILAAPPTQRTETTVMPVWHSISVHIVLDSATEVEVNNNADEEVAVEHEGG